MVWFFERGLETAICEVSRHPTHFEVAVWTAGGSPSVAVAHGATELLAQIERVPQSLIREGWRPKRTVSLAY
jgi:hypothetical protein